MIFSVEKPLDVVFVIFGSALSIKLGVIVEEIGVDLVEEPGFLEDVRLKEDKEGGRDPVDEGTCWPLMGKGQMQELKNLEEGPETIHEPVLIIFGDSSLQKIL
jgi:hypothetical protein